MYTLEILESIEGKLYIELPDDLIDYLSWIEGDLLEWKNKQGGIQLTKVNDPLGYEVIED